MWQGRTHMDLLLPNAWSKRNTAGFGLTGLQVLTASAYGVLGAVLLVSRLVGLDHGFWLDEAVFVENYVREGPHKILLGGGLSHELYGVLDWATASVVGESVVAFRLWSAVPFVLGVALVTTWLHRRHDPLAGLLFLFLATVSPLLLDISRQARGYGLAFLAMAVVIVAALEAQRAGRTAAVVLMCAAGVVGTWTLPQFGIGFAATLVVLLDRSPPQSESRDRARRLGGRDPRLVLAPLPSGPRCVAERGRRRPDHDDLGHHGPD